eukprot:CAMPEP_0179856984 /NCGR_PEP_ID=MMETSP0982-20121206/11496_1 /TAXON_ID=483367 /ORGANISM="non described non described, Strain CCMP 2436" /LENGTH=34 /DNA_ID= /DNA_START= /DNA_END= /DNA_ORIENTATION=
MSFNGWCPAPFIELEAQEYQINNPAKIERPAAGE